MDTVYQSDVERIESVVLMHARDAFVDDAVLGRHWRSLNYAARPDFRRAVDEYERFVACLRSFNIDVHFLPRGDGLTPDSIYVRDACLVCDRGVILCNMGKPLRHAEPGAAGVLAAAMGVPIAGRIEGDATLEGGDVVWLDPRTVAVGRGYRTNDEGIRQLRDLLEGCVDEVITVPLPHWKGPEDVFHLMSIVSPIDRDLLLVYSPLLPVRFREALAARRFDLVEVAPAEFETLGCNALAVAPRRCLMVAGNPETRARLEAAGVEVHKFDGAEICAKGAGGPTCLARPLHRRR